MALLLSMLLTEGLWLISLLIRPWNREVWPFLGIWTAAFASYFYSWNLVRKNRISPRTLWTIICGGLLFRATLFFAPPTLSDDIYRYLWDGRVQAAGINPYHHAPEDPKLSFLRDENYSSINHRSVKTIYPPLSQLMFRAVARVSPPEWHLTFQKAVILFFDTALIFLLIFYLRKKQLPPENVLLYAWNPLILVEFSSSGHLDSIGLFFLVAGLAAFDVGKTRTAGISLALAFLGKLASLPLLPWMILKRSACAAVVPFVAVVATGYCLFLHWPLSELTGSLLSGAKTYAEHWYFNAGLYALFSELIDLSPDNLKMFISVFLAAVAVLLAWRLPASEVLKYFGIIWALMLALSPVVHPWYATWLVPVLCFFPLWGGLVFTGLLGLSYVVLAGYASTGAWALPVWVPWVEYGGAGSILIAEVLRGRFTSSGPVRWTIPAAGVVSPCVIIPALNEEEALPRVIADIPDARKNRIIVVDNGSTDATSRVAHESGAEVVSEKRRGYGRAVLAGLGGVPTDCDAIVVLDADYSDHPEEMNELLKPLEENQADFVIGSRVTGTALPGALTPQQRFGNWLSCVLIRLLYGRKFTDLGPFRAVRRDLLETLALDDVSFGWNVEMQIKALRAGARVIEVPVRYRPRIGVSKISGTLHGTILAGTKILWTILKHALIRPRAAGA